MTERLVASLLDYAGGSTPVTVGLSRLLMDCTSEAEARRALDAAATLWTDDTSGADRLRALRELWAQHPDAFAAVRMTMDRLNDPSAGRFGVTDWAKAFDRGRRRLA